MIASPYETPSPRNPEKKSKKNARTEPRIEISESNNRPIYRLLQFSGTGS
jgi:hypothetical protein